MGVGWSAYLRGKTVQKLSDCSEKIIYVIPPACKVQKFNFFLLTKPYPPRFNTVAVLLNEQRNEKTYHCSGNTKRNRKGCQVRCNVKIVRKFIDASSFKHFSLKSRRGFQPTRRILVTLLAPRGVKVTTFIPRRIFSHPTHQGREIN